MPRPPKWRRVAFMPEVTHFNPAGAPSGAVEKVSLSLEEAEALRLRDLVGLEQEQCAEKMNISRPTFHRVLESARRKVADALLNGKAIRIEGGNYELVTRRFRCLQGHEWAMPSEQMAARLPAACPRCHSLNISPVAPDELGLPGRGWRRRRRGGRSW